MAQKKTDQQFDPTALVESAFLMGIGALELTREKVGEITDDLIERGKLSRSEAKKVGSRLGEAAKEQQQAVRGLVEKETERALKVSGLATRREVEALHHEIAELKALLAAERGGGSTRGRKTSTTTRKPAAKPKRAAKPASKS